MKTISKSPKGPKIVPFLWFDTQAEEAAKYYVSLFKNSKIKNISRYPEEGKEITGGKPGSVMVVDFILDGQEFSALNGGPDFKFNEAISFTINCQTTQEVDHFWERLSEGGAKWECGWLKDKYGVFWQVVPTILGKLMSDPDPVKSGRVMNAMLKMTKLDIDVLKKAYEGK